MCTHLRFRVCGLRLSMNRMRIFVSMSFGSRDISAFSRLRNRCTIMATTNHRTAHNTRSVQRRNKELYSTHSMGVSNPGTLPFRFVNLRMNEYTNKQSHRSDGCVAVDGGQTCPLRSGLTPGAAMARERVKEKVRKEGENAPIANLCCSWW